ncbi:MAG: orotate phosphoribosyltransferase [Oscillospiraceae bacterium]|nr:orotate phosphoribosyltransferase [Oscillospiraceae bacterium]MBQ9939677.1 orotate phosphoribosyltransferase [Oscillospiraceae bacterium]
MSLSAEKRRFIEFMTGAGVLRFGEFMTKSGRLSPYFVNTGLYRTGAQISALGDFYAQLIHDSIGDDFTAMFGPAYKGIPLAVTTAGALSRNYSVDKPFFFNRKEAKDHGEGGSFVGYAPQNGDKVIIIEDVITAGTALREVMPMLLGCADITVKDMFISVDRCERGQNAALSAVKEAEQNYGIKVHPIVTVYDILEYLREDPANAAHVEAMERYIAQYC